MTNSHIMNIFFFLPLIFAFINEGICHDDHRGPGSSGMYQRDTKKKDNEDLNYWREKGTSELEKAINLQLNENIAKNIILFIGDGMSLPTVAAARTYKSQQKNKTEEDQLADYDGSSTKLSWEEFPHVGLSMTYNSDYMVPDSSSTAFAMYTGVKTSGYTMGYDYSVRYMDMSSQENATEVTTVLDWAQERGMKTGFVTTTRMSHATPAALYSKTVSRFWECEQDIWDDIEDGNVSEEDYVKYHPKDITAQLVESEAGQKIDIMLGGGRASWEPCNEYSTRWDYDTYDWNCTRHDGRNLIQEWEGNHTGGIYVKNRDELMNLTYTEDSVLGIFSNSYVYWDNEVNDTNNIPRLVDMATQAVKFLQEKSGPEGYFVMIEAGRIDAAHHNGEATKALSETLAFDKAIEEVMKLVNTEDTLVIVTADHAHTMSIGGYTGRFHDITGVVEDPRGGEDSNAADGESLSILSYGNGPGFEKLNTTGPGDWTNIERFPLDRDQAADYSYLQPSGQPIKSETHGGDDVGIWAVGPMAHLFHGVHEQSYIAHVMSYSACIGLHSNYARCSGARTTVPAPSSSSTITSSWSIMAVAVLLKLFQYFDQ